MKSHFPLIINVKLFIFLSIAFFVAVIIGTLSHELGHYAVAKYLGYSTSISYGYTYWNDIATQHFYEATISTYQYEIENGLQFPNKQEFDFINQKYIEDGFWITLGGPIETLITGSFGFLLLLISRKRISTTHSLKLRHWLYVFICLFWLRQIVNVLTWLLGYIINGKFRLNSDEIRLAQHFNLPISTLILSTAMIALSIFSFIILKIIPTHQRISFIAAGFAGGILGYLFWLVWFGPIIMP